MVHQIISNIIFLIAPKLFAFEIKENFDEKYLSLKYKDSDLDFSKYDIKDYLIVYKLLG